MKEVRNGNLIAAIKTKLPNVGLVNLDTTSGGRKAFFTWRTMDFVVSSRLMIKELGFGRLRSKHTNDSPTAAMLQERLREGVTA
jgi:hypothetical protein